MERDNSFPAPTNTSSDDPDRTSRYLSEICQQINKLSAEIQRVSAKQEELAQEVLMLHDRIDNLEHCNRQATDIEGAVQAALQRIRITEDAIRNIHIINSETRFQILEATCEHLTVRANRLATMIVTRILSRIPQE